MLRQRSIFVFWVFDYSLGELYEQTPGLCETKRVNVKQTCKHRPFWGKETRHSGNGLGKIYYSIQDGST